MKFYSKILIAKYNPENKCFADDDTVLYANPFIFKKLVSSKSLTFRSTINPSIKSSYGWIKEVEPFTLDDFILKHFDNIELNTMEIEAIELLLDSIIKFDAGTPMGATYFQRGIEKQYMALSIHKVIFYKK